MFKKKYKMKAKTYIIYKLVRVKLVLLFLLLIFVNCSEGIKNDKINVIQ